MNDERTQTMAQTQQSASKATSTTPFVFNYRLDIYWKALAIYALTFILYAIIRGTIQPTNFSITYDPILLILFVFIILGAFAVTLHSFLRRQIVITPGEIRIQNRLRSLTLPIAEIRTIRFRQFRLTKGGPQYRMVLIYLHHRRRPIRIRPQLYENDQQLIELLQTLKQQGKRG